MDKDVDYLPEENPDKITRKEFFLFFACY